MSQILLTPIKCTLCKKEYCETGHWRDGIYCPVCSEKMKQKEDERKKEIKEKAAAIREKYGLDFSKYPDGLPEELKRELNPRNAGRKQVKYDNSFCELLIDAASEGKSEAEFAAEMKVSQSVIQYWTKYPKFKEAREIANELRNAWLEKTFRYAMLKKIDSQPSLMLRLVSVKLGWGDKNETVVKGTGEIPVLKIVEHDSSFPSETLPPTAEQMKEAGLNDEGSRTQ